ncbi:hypothetical protein FQZ97_859610 [compost metagenome]
MRCSPVARPCAMRWHKRSNSRAWPRPSNSSVWPSARCTTRSPTPRNACSSASPSPLSRRCNTAWSTCGCTANSRAPRPKTRCSTGTAQETRHNARSRCAPHARAPPAAPCWWARPRSTCTVAWALPTRPTSACASNARSHFRPGWAIRCGSAASSWTNCKRPAACASSTVARPSHWPTVWTWTTCPTMSSATCWPTGSPPTTRPKNAS